MTARQMAHQWRTGDALQRACIEEQITREGIGHMFTCRDGVLRARCDWGQITASGGGAYRTAADRRMVFTPAVIELAGIHTRAPSASLDGCDVSVVEAEVHRELGRAA